MKNQEYEKVFTFDKLFIHELQEVYSAEIQIVDFLPTLIQTAENTDLKEGLTKHLKESKEQIRRLEKIFSLIGITAKAKRCIAMEAMLEEASKIIQNKSKSPTLDAAIICAAQKVEHFEMAVYGSLHCFAKCLECDKEVLNLIHTTLEEEAAADKSLTKVAEGTLFTSGVNKEAAEICCSKR